MSDLASFLWSFGGMAALLAAAAARLALRLRRARTELARLEAA